MDGFDLVPQQMDQTGADATDAGEFFDTAKGPRGDDGLSIGGADAEEGLQLGLGGVVDVDAQGVGHFGGLAVGHGGLADDPTHEDRTDDDGQGLPPGRDFVRSDVEEASTAAVLAA